MDTSSPKKNGVPTGPLPLRVARVSARGIGGGSPDNDAKLADNARLHELELENRRLQMTVRRLRQLAFVDGLTGLANRRHFNLVLRSEIRRAYRFGTPLALMLCDLDHFKRVNDSLGHQAGDEVLCVLAQLLSGACRRAGDIAARYGGEEFALLLPGVNSKEAPEIAARLCRNIATSSIVCSRSARTTRVTASFGISVLEANSCCSPGDLVSAADTALYEAKNCGRNRVRFRAVD
jgi:diguanylate cyclase (GGDEF)-like protein